METLGDWKKLSVVLFGDDSEATKFLDEKIAEQGENEKVVADEGQMIYLLVTLHKKGLAK